MSEKDAPLAAIDERLDESSSEIGDAILENKKDVNTIPHPRILSYVDQKNNKKDNEL
jgi:hypothetical protein